MFESVVGAGAFRFRGITRACAWTLACVVVALVAVWSVGTVERRSIAPTAARPVVHTRSLSSLPVALQPIVSSVVGAGRASFAIHGLRSVGGGLTTRFARSGPTVSGAGGAALGLHVTGVGRGRSIAALPSANPSSSNNQVLYRRGGVTEWYRNGPLGLEQGFTVARQPAGGSGWLTISERLRGAMRARLSGSGIVFSHAGRAFVRLDQLSAIDARGRALRSHFQLRGSSVVIRIDDAGATYPVKVDPTLQQGPAMDPDPTGIALFGYAVAVSSDGNTAVIGAPSDSSDVGAAWVFTRSGSTWTQQSKFTANGEVGKGAFGTAVALSSDGNTALVGAPDDGSTGAAWVFTRSGSSWSQQAEVVPNGDAVGSRVRFGSSVALSSDATSALVGGPADTPNPGAGVGAAWVFTQSGSNWTEQAKLTPSDSSGKGEVGWSVALSSDGNTALVGSTYDDAAWVFTRSGTSWSQQGAKLSPNDGVGSSQDFGDFGSAVALSSDGNTAMIGGPADSSNAGAAWIFTRSGSTWTQQGPKLTPNDGVGPQVAFGGSVALSSDGNTAMIGGPGDNYIADYSSSVGAAWVFVRSGSAWTQVGSKLIPDKTWNGQDGVGLSVALSSDGGTALVGGHGGAWAFQLDTVTPAALDLVSPANGAQNLPHRPTLTWDAASGSVARYETWIDGVEDDTISPSTCSGGTCTGQPGYYLENGLHHWLVKVVYTDGTIGSSDSWSFNVDGIPPADFTTIAPAYGAAVNTPQPTFSWHESSDSGSGLDHYELWFGYTKDQDIPLSACSGGVCSVTSTRTFADGKYTWQVRAVDKVGNTTTGNGGGQLPFTVDTRPPADFHLLGPANHAQNLGPSPKFSWAQKADPGSGINHYELWIDGSNKQNVATSACVNGTCSAQVSTPLSGGSHTWFVKAVDQAGNVRNSLDTWDFTVDATPPSAFDLVGPANGTAINAGQTTFTWDASSDPGSGVDHYELWIGGQDQVHIPASTCSGGTCSVHANTGFSGGTYSWLIKAVDGAGNVRDSNETWNFLIDRTQPVAFSLKTPANGAALTAPSFSWQASSDASSGIDHYELWIDGSKNRDVAPSACSAGTCSTTATGIADGRHNWLVKAVDRAGNAKSSTQIWAFTLDTTPPVAFTLFNPGPGGANQAPRTSFSWQQTTDAVTGVDHYELWIDGSNNQNVASSACSGGTCSATATAALADGSHSWLVKAVDGVGNLRTSATRSFSVTAPPANTSRPTITGNAQQGQTLTESHGSWTGSPTSFRYQWADCDGSVSNCVPISGAIAQTYTLTLADAGHRVVALETAVNGGGASAAAQSNGTTTVIPLPPANVSPPTINGTAAIGRTLTEVHGGWTNNPTSYTYQWQSCNPTGASCAAISGATGQTYTVRSGDVDKTFRVLESAYNQGGRSGAAASAATAPVPPNGPVGVLINGGDYATNNPHVTVSLVWPTRARQVVLSNDGGFGSTGNAHSFSMAPKIPWTLKQTGSNRLSKLVYVRFLGAGIDYTGFIDDIVLDQAAPTVRSAKLLGATQPKAHASPAKGHTYSIKVAANDPIVGVCSIQVSSKRSGGTTLHVTNCRKRGILRITRTLHVTARNRPKYLRVKNSAGSWSRWKTLG